MKFYTNFTQYRNDILVRGYENGKPFKEKVKYSPYLFVPSKKETAKYKALDGTKLEKFEFDTISDAKEFINKYREVENFKFYGSNNWPYLYIFDEYKEDIKYDVTLIRVANIDIEVAANPEDGFPDISLADKEITAITMRIKGETFAFGCGEYTPKEKNVYYIKCKNEIELLKKFIAFWTQENFFPDVITGWNVAWFDIPYLVNRIARMLNMDEAKKLSPWNALFPKEIFVKGKLQQTYSIIGISVLDYMDLYKKFSYTPQESYRLDNVAFEEVGVQKVDYSEYGNLLGLYKMNYEKFMDYNIHDTYLVELIDKKHKFIELIFTMAYNAKVNFDDTLRTVRPWDVIVHNFLLPRSIVVPFMEDNARETIPGGFVKEPRLGEHKWVVSFDLDSLYPHLIMQYTISPDSLITKEKLADMIKSAQNRGDNKAVEDLQKIEKAIEFVSIDDFFYKKFDTSILEPYNMAITANGVLYDKRKQGFLAEIMDTMYKQRSEYKKIMLEAEKEYEKTKDESLVFKIAQYKNLQLVKKIQMNSLYGALANPYYRHYNVHMAASITTSGQLTIRWVERDINNYLNKVLGTEGVDFILAADTDSVYITLNALVEKVLGKDETDNQKIVDFLDKVCKTKLSEVIDKSYDDLYHYMNAYEPRMHMKRETISNKCIWTGAKNYIMNVYDKEGTRYKEPKIKMVGIAAIKTSYPKLAREKMKESIKVIMNGTEKELLEYVTKFKEDFFKLPVETIAFPRGISEVDKYVDGDRYKKRTGVHIKGAINYNNYLKKKGLLNQYQQISAGDKIKYIHLTEPNPVHDDVIAFLDVFPPEFKLDNYIDRRRQFEKVYLQPLRIITDVIKWRTEKRSNLEELI